MSLSKAGTRIVHQAVDSMFDRLRERAFGVKTPSSKVIGIGLRPDLTLSSLYQDAARAEGATPDQTTENALMSVAESYLEAQRERSKAQVVSDVNAFLTNAKIQGTATDLKTVLGGQLAETFSKISSEVHRIVDTEAQKGRAMGALEGIVKINENSGIDDPTVYFVIVRDDHVCSECLRLHQLDGTLSGPPRLWKLSQIGHGYHKRGDTSPKVGGLHPHCRCSLATLMPGYGFDAAGSVAYIAPGHDEYAKQQEQADDGERWFDLSDLKKTEEHDSDSCPDCKESPSGKCAQWKPPTFKAPAPGAAVPANPAKKPKKVKEPPPPALVVVHNLTEDNFHHAHALGGLAAPSLAVAHKDYPFAGFGDITLVADPHLADPKVTPVFDADIYSPRHPRSKNTINERAANQFTKWLEPHAKMTDTYMHSFMDEVENNGAEGVMGHRSYAPALQAAYLSEIGQPAAPVMRQKRLSNDWLAEKPIKDFVEKHKGTSYLTEAQRSEFSAAAKDAIHRFAERNFPDDRESQETVKQAHLEDNFNDTGDLYYGRSDKFWHEVKDGASQEPDKYKTIANVEQSFDALPQSKKDEFKKWVKEKIAPVLAGRYIPRHVDSANGPRIRKIPYTLDNVLKELTRTIRQGESFNYGLGTARAAGAKRFRNLEQIKAARSKLVSAEEMTKAKAANDERFSKLVDELKPYHESGGFGVMDALAQSIGDSYKKGRYLHGELKENGFNNIPLDLHQKVARFANDLVQMPTEYFEAKPQRAVSFTEFKGAAIPHDTRQETIDLLHRYGVDTEFYPRGDDKARWEAVRRLSEAKKLMLAEGAW